MFFFDDNEIIKGLKKYPVLSHFSESALKKLVNQSEMVKIGANQTLFTCRDPSDSVYYLLDGHLEGYSTDELKIKVLSFRAGELVGEIGVVAGESRGMAVKATRESNVLKIDKQVFIKYFQNDTELLTVLAQTMAKRLRSLILNAHTAHYEYKNIGLIALFKSIPMDEIKAAFMPRIEEDSFHLYDEEDFKRTQLEPINFFYQCETNYGVNLFLCSNTDDPWSKSVLDHVDYIYLITVEGSWDLLDPYVLEQIRQRPCDLAILHKNPPPFKHTSLFYKRHPFKRHHHLMSSKKDFERLYRFMTGQAIGLVLSGGGLRGFVHYGLVKALFESKIPIDFIGGSSIGAAIAAMLAIDFDWAYFDKVFQYNMQQLKKTFFLKNLTLPLVSILSGRALTLVIKKQFGDYRIENLPTNYFCIVSNLSGSKKKIATRGLLWEWLRASTSVPGLAPPFEKNGTIYVDGSVCSNLPVHEMRTLLNDVGKIIAFNLQIPPFKNQRYRFPPILGMKKMIAYCFGLSRKRYCFPSIVDILTESPLINQYADAVDAAKSADIMISPDVSMHSFMVAKNSDISIQPAYELAKEKFSKKLFLFKRWID